MRIFPDVPTRGASLKVSFSCTSGLTIVARVVGNRIGVVVSGGACSVDLFASTLTLLAKTQTIMIAKPVWMKTG